MKPAELKSVVIGINRWHAHVTVHLSNALLRARRAGVLLLMAKQAVPHGRCSAWLKANLDGSKSTARYYMRIASGWDRLNAENGNAVADLPIREALQALKKRRTLPLWERVTNSEAARRPAPERVTEPQPTSVTIEVESPNGGEDPAAPGTASDALERAVTRQEVEALIAAWRAASPAARNQFEAWLARQRRVRGESPALLKLASPR